MTQFFFILATAFFTSPLWAFSVSNNTDTQIKVNLRTDSWMYDHNYTIQPNETIELDAKSKKQDEYFKINLYKPDAKWYSLDLYFDQWFIVAPSEASFSISFDQDSNSFWLSVNGEGVI